MINYFLPTFPALRRITSPSYAIPFPLYGSGERTALILAANSPTASFSKPETTITVGLSRLIDQLGGVSIRTGLL